MKTIEEKKKELIKKYLDKGILISPEVLEKELNGDEVKKPKDVLVLTEDSTDIGQGDVNWPEVDKFRVRLEKGKDDKAYYKVLSSLKSEEKAEGSEKYGGVVLKRNYKIESHKRCAQDFVKYFTQRYYAIEKLLRGRSELQAPVSISRIKHRKDRAQASIIGIVKEKRRTKNNNLILTVEDPSEEINVLVNKNKPELFSHAEDIVEDEVIGISGASGENILFANSIVWPDMPIIEQKKADEEGYAVFISDLHVGSEKFLEEDFKKFLMWIRGEAGNDSQKEIAAKVKYLFIVGDIVDGCGVYPNQEEELAIKDITEQYSHCAKLLRQVPQDIQIIICPGNHDAVRMSEPQPPFYADFAQPLFELPNATLVSNPAVVNIHSSKDFAGLDVLLYHGYSFDYLIANVDSIRAKGGYDNAEVVMKFLLKRRHLAPTHASSLYVPDTNKDPLVIDTVPDFFVTGHIHKSKTGQYKNITLICCSCWQDKTPFQEKVGHHPEPGRVPVVNLKTREIRILKFGK